MVWQGFLYHFQIGSWGSEIVALQGPFNGLGIEVVLSLPAELTRKILQTTLGNRNLLREGFSMVGKRKSWAHEIEKSVKSPICPLSWYLQVESKWFREKRWILKLGWSLKAAECGDSECLISLELICKIRIRHFHLPLPDFRVGRHMWASLYNQAIY